MRDPATIKEFAFVRGELFFQPMLTFSLAVTGYHAIVKPDSFESRRTDHISYRLGGLIIGGLVCGSIVKALDVAKTVKMGHEVNEVAFEEGKQLFNEFLRPGDIPVLLSDIRQLLLPK